MGDVIEILTTATNTVEVEAQGPQGIPGVGVPTGGSAGQVLRKASSADYATEWAAAGSGSGSVTSVAMASTDLTISGSPITDAGTITANIAANAVTLEKLQTISSEHLLGRHGSGNGVVQQIGLGTGLAISGSNVGVTFGSSAGTACEGNDARLSDARTPSSTLAHSSTHHTGGTDAIAPSDIGAQSIFVTEDLGTITTDANLTSSRAKIYTVIVNTFAAPTPSVRLPSTNIMAGDVVQIRFSSFTGRTMPIKNGDGSFLGAGLSSGQQATFIAASTASNSWAESPNNRFAVGTSSGVPIITGSSGYIGAGAFGTSAGQFAEGNHAHGNITNNGKIGTTAGLPVVTTTAGAVTTLALGTANQVLRVNSGATGVEFADPAASGVSSVSSSASDVLGVSGANITGVDANADRIIFWDDSASALKHLTVGSGLSLTDTTLTATATGTIGGSTGATDNLLLRSDGTGAATLQNSALQLDDATTSTQANVALVNAHSETNSAIVLTPKGTGAFIVGPKPDGTASVGGNARGLKAVDLSYQRSAATQVASGNYSMVLGGDRCTSSNLCTIAAGETAVASGQYAVALGRANTASATASAAVGGQSNTASGAESFVVGGNFNTASAHASAALGTYALADRGGLLAQANGTFGAGTSADGTAQWINMVLRAKTTTNTAVELLINNGRVTNGRLACPSGKIISGIINIHGVKSDGTASAHYVRQFQVKNVGGTSSYPYTAATVGTDYASSTSITFNDPDTNGDALSVSVTGIASETWRWTAHVSAVETTYGT